MFINKSIKSLILIGLFYLLLELSGKSSTYYVDYDGGSDLNNGTTTITAWKHCPGDVNATDVPLNKHVSGLLPGDTILFKGGVIYRGVIEANDAGSNGAPITLKGNGWGAQRAIISGSEIIATPWVQCTNSSDARGNPDYSNMWWTTCPSDMKFYTTLSKGDTLYYPGQDPNPPVDFIRWQELDHYKTADTNHITITNLTDASYFTQPDSSFYVGSYVYVWVNGNDLEVSAITNYDTVSHTVSFGLTRSILFQDGITRWKILNNPAFLDQPGEYSVQTNENRLYLCWTNQPVGIEVAQRGKCIWRNAGSYFWVEGFKMIGVSADAPVAPQYSGSGIAVWNGGSVNTSNIWIIDNEFLLCNSPISVLYSLYLSITSHAYIWSNTVHDCLNRGIGYSGLNQGSILSNVVYRTCGTGLSTGAGHVEIAYNVLHDVQGIHANGYSTYGLDSDNPMVGNRVHHNIGYGGPRIYTIDAVQDLWVYNNIFDSRGYEQGVLDYGLNSGTNFFYNNTIIGESNNRSLVLCAFTNDAWVVVNNIIGGFAPTVGDWNTRTNYYHSNNLYTALSIWQDWHDAYWVFGTGEIVNTNLSQVMINAPSLDYRLIGGSPAINSGVNLSAFFTNDFSGQNRSGFGAWDMGAYEYISPHVTILGKAKFLGKATIR